MAGLNAGPGRNPGEIHRPKPTATPALGGPWAGERGVGWGKKRVIP